MSLQKIAKRTCACLLFAQRLVQNLTHATRTGLLGMVLGLSCWIPSIAHSSEAAATPGFLQGTVYDRVGSSEGVSPTLLYAVALTESGRAIGDRDDQVAPWPYVLRALDARYYADNEADYRVAYQLFKEKYGDKFDVGPVQVNVYWQVTRAGRVADAEELLDLETNLEIGAQVLREAMASTDDMALGIGRYHTWSDKIRARIFGERVLAVHRNLIENHK